MNSFGYVVRDDLLALKKITTGYVCLNGSYDAISDAYDQYKALKGSTSIVPLGLNAGQVETLKLAYKNRPAKFKLDWINEVLNHTLLACPMCGGSGGRTLEHYLPKTPYPEFAVFSYNLFPSCGSCNSKRGSKNKHLAFPALLHPYFDEKTLNSIELITNFTIRNGVPGFELKFNSSHFDAATRHRIEYHLEVSLDNLDFRNHSGGYLNKAFHRVQDYNNYNGYIFAIKKDLELCERSGSRNSWEAAFMRGLLALSIFDFNKLLGANYI